MEIKVSLGYRIRTAISTWIIHVLNGKTMEEHSEEKLKLYGALDKACREYQALQKAIADSEKGESFMNLNRPDDKNKYFDALCDRSHELLVGPTDAQTALNVIGYYLLGSCFYVPEPVSQEQVNTVLVDKILTKCSQLYRREKPGMCDARNSEGVKLHAD